MLDVLRDNRVFFASQTAGILLLPLLAQIVDFPLLVDVPLAAVCGLSLAWMLSVLLTSALVPDRCSLCGIDWIPERVPGSPKAIAVVHAGLGADGAGAALSIPAAGSGLTGLRSKIDRTVMHAIIPSWKATFRSALQPIEVGSFAKCKQNLTCKLIFAMKFA
ncbi:MAG: hypothetical protein HYY18_20055 [Planctomycetes bacterium]|nr:hypothetical protein [Planctomycetota bacterium]